MIPYNPWIIFLILISLSGTIQGQNQSKLFQDRLVQSVIDIRDDIIYNKSRDKEREQRIKNILDNAPLSTYGKSYLKSYFLNPDPDDIFSLDARAFVDGDISQSLDFLGEPILIKDSTDRADWLLSGMVYLEIIENEYPYKLKDLKLITRELESYNITNGLRIADVRAGEGWISLLIASVFEDIELYVSEINRNQLLKLGRMLPQAYSVNGSNHIKLVQGTDRSTNLEREGIDVMIMRHMLHQVQQQTKYLNSIKNSLSKDGKVYLLSIIKLKGMRVLIMKKH